MRFRCRFADACENGALVFFRVVGLVGGVLAALAARGTVQTVFRKLGSKPHPGERATPSSGFHRRGMPGSITTAAASPDLQREMAELAARRREVGRMDSVRLGWWRRGEDGFAAYFGTKDPRCTV